MSDLVVIGSIRGCSDQADLAMIRAIDGPNSNAIKVANNRFADATSWDEFANRLEFHRQLIADIQMSRIPMHIAKLQSVTFRVLFLMESPYELESVVWSTSLYRFREYQFKLI